jgi:hypothetical protein
MTDGAAREIRVAVAAPHASALALNSVCGFELRAEP